MLSAYFRMWNKASLTCKCLCVSASVWWYLGESPQDDVRLGIVSRPGGVQPLRCLEAAGPLSLEHRAGPLRSLRGHMRSHTRFRMEESGCAHTLHCVTLSLKHDCSAWAVSFHWTWEWCHITACVAHSWLCCISTADLCSVPHYTMGAVAKRCHLYQIMTLKG